ncbi:hypothetical protein FACS1894170_00140 [Planctomycetales bacterium]|nr:hypothetical protein FACS1894170_00140 [Planctomycetales bacterium]
MASNLLRYLIAFVLFLAAVLKTYQLSSGPLPSVIQGSVFTPLLELFNHRLLLTGVIEVELLAALVLIFGRWTFPVWLATLFCFTVFAVVAMMKGLSGEASCGCFGKAAVNPWFTASFDTVIILLLLICRPVSVAFKPLLHFLPSSCGCYSSFGFVLLSRF